MTSLTEPEKRRLFIYLGALAALFAVSDPNGGLIDLPLSFILKNRLHLEAHEVALFRLIASIPFCLSFLFGLARDMLYYRGHSDRRLMLVFSLFSVVAYVVFAHIIDPSYTSLLAATTLSTCLYLIALSSQSGLTAVIGQQHAMTGQISAAWNVGSYAFLASGFFVGGYLSQYLESQSVEFGIQMLFLLSATNSWLIVLFLLPRPSSVYNIATKDERSWKRQVNLKIFARHFAVYPALTIWLLWNFSPGSITPLQYFLQNDLGATDSQWGLWNAIFTIAFLPAFVSYGFLSSRVKFKTLIWYGTFFGIPQFVPLLFLHSLKDALVVAIPIGFMGGVATAAYLDLIIRSCPNGLQGTTLMTAGGLYFISTRVGDVLGSYVFDHFGGFPVCVVIMIATYCMIPVIILFLPKELFATDIP